MIGAPLPPSLSLHLPASPLLRPAAAAGLGQAAHTAHAAGWLEGLGLNAGTVLRADVSGELRGLSVQQHAERVLDALVG
mgnify:CR=1 FL=1